MLQAPTLLCESVLNNVYKKVQITYTTLCACCKWEHLQIHPLHVHRPLVAKLMHD